MRLMLRFVEKGEEEARPDSREHVPDEPKVEEKKEPGKIKPKSTVTMPVALNRIHDTDFSYRVTATSLETLPHVN